MNDNYGMTDNLGLPTVPGGYGMAKIKVIGVGGGGGNAINRMILAGVSSCTFVAANTDMQALNLSRAQYKIQLGANLTKGLGAGADPEMGARAAEESKDAIAEVLKDTDLLFIAAGMGGGTGTGAAPVIAKMAKDLNILTIAVVTKPFETFEGKTRMDNANAGIEKLKGVVDTLLIIPNEKIQLYVPKGTPLVQAFKVADDVLRQGIQGITDIIVTPSLINLDFADIKAIMKNKGNAHIGIGKGKGDNRTLDAVRQAVQSPLLETNIQGATGLIIYVSGGTGLTIDEVHDSVSLVKEVVDPNAKIIFGMGIDEELQDEVMITIIATGFEPQQENKNIYTSPRPMFSSRNERNPQMDSMYGFGADALGRSDSGHAVREVAAADEIPPIRQETRDNKNIPPFLQRLKDKR